MSRDKQSLRAELAALFERACHEHDYLVAEYLLQALEAIAQRDDDAEQVEDAYLKLASSFRAPPLS
ncbi:MAG: hypothetical protein NVSMB6_00490 [Burkholderiaceae bacterium]